MQNLQGNLEYQMVDYSSRLKSINSYIKELSATTANHGTDHQHFEDDLREAEHNVRYYEGEITRLKEELGKSGSAKPADHVKPGIKKPGILSLVLTPIGFLAGAVLGSKLKSRDKS